MSDRLPCGRFYGRLVQQQDADGLVFSEGRYPADSSTPKHHHESAYFCLILSGGGAQTFGSRTRDFKPLTTIFYPPGELQSERFGKTDVHTFSFELSAYWLDRFRRHSAVLDRSSSVDGGLLASLALRLRREVRMFDEVSPLAIEGLTLEIIAEVARQAPPAKRYMPPWIERVREYVDAHFADRFTLARLASLSGVHPVHLAAVFRRAYGRSVGEYVRALRVNAASQALSTPDTPIVEIAFATGFSSQAHFSRVFKRATGLTPTEYRVRHHTG
jgi:AraC family transcriptional regulator